MRFEYHAPTRIVFGDGRLAEAGALAGAYGSHALVTTGVRGELPEALQAGLSTAGVALTTLSVPGEPTTTLVEQGLALARQGGCDLVIGFGGGSAIDTAKAIAALLANEGELLDYLEVIGRGRTLARPGLPCIAIPTTAGTGAEVTRNAVLASPAHRVKVSLRSPLMVPRVAIVDPELTYSMPPDVTASTGLDALTQVIEPFVSARANPVTDALCRDAMGRAARSLRRAWADGGDRQAREDMALVSLFGGLALANAGLGVVHGFAGVLGGMFPAPHGAICARLLPGAMEVNVRALHDRQPSGASLARFDEVARILTGAPDATAEDAVAWLEQLVHDLGVPGLAAYGLAPADSDAVVAKTAVASSTKANPIVLTPAELSVILAGAL